LTVGLGPDERSSSKGEDMLSHKSCVCVWNKCSNWTDSHAVETKKKKKNIYIYIYIYIYTLPHHFMIRFFFYVNLKSVGLDLKVQIHTQERHTYLNTARIDRKCIRTTYCIAHCILIIKPTRCTNFSSLFLE